MTKLEIAGKWSSFTVQDEVVVAVAVGGYTSLRSNEVIAIDLDRLSDPLHTLRNPGGVVTDGNRINASDVALKVCPSVRLQVPGPGVRCPRRNAGLEVISISV